MHTNTRTLLVSVCTAAAVLCAVSLAFGRYARGHFVPEATLARALAAGPGSVLTLGDSRMAAGVDTDVMEAALAAAGVPRRVGSLGIGAVGPPGNAMSLRRLFDAGGKAGVVVLGGSTGSFVMAQPIVDPADLIGNRAIELAWSEASDVWRYYPSFPLADLDRGLRFTTARLTSLGTYASLVWSKVQGAEQAVLHPAKAGPRNRFGDVDDMRALGERSRREALAKVAHMEDPRLSAWLALMMEEAEAAGAHLVVVDVPMPSSYRDEVTSSPQGRRYAAWLRRELEARGATYVELTSIADDATFEDGVHLNTEGARTFSRALADAVAPLLTPTPSARAPTQAR